MKKTTIKKVTMKIKKEKVTVTKKIKVEVSADYSYELAMGVVDKEEAKKIRELGKDLYFASCDELEELGQEHWTDFGNLYKGIGFFKNELKVEITVDGKKEDIEPETKDIWFQDLNVGQRKPKKGNTILISGLPNESASAEISFEVQLKKDEEFDPECLVWVNVSFPEEFTWKLDDYRDFDSGMIIGMAYMRDFDKTLKKEDIHYFDSWDDGGNSGYNLFEPCLIKYTRGC